MPLLTDVARALRRIAHDIEETAKGSSRHEMYRALASELLDEAVKLERESTAAPRAMEFRG